MGFTPPVDAEHSECPGEMGGEARCFTVEESVGVEAITAEVATELERLGALMGEADCQTGFSIDYRMQLAEAVDGTVMIGVGATPEGRLELVVTPQNYGIE